MKESSADKELDLHFLQADLHSLVSINAAAQKFKTTESRLDTFVANAGLGSTIRRFRYTMAERLSVPFPLDQSTAASTAAADSTPGRVWIVIVSSDVVFVSIAPDLDLANPNIDYIKGIMGCRVDPSPLLSLKAGFIISLTYS